jgi:predicted enzyme related to lactoylglutathione lyase
VNFNSILIGSADPRRLADYYRKLLGEPTWDEGEAGYVSWQLGSGFVSVGPHSEVTGQNTQPGRLLWNIESTDVKADYDRFVQAGATVVREPYDPAEGGEQAGTMLIATFSDPDGNYFQLMSPMSPDPAG